MSKTYIILLAIISSLTLSAQQGQMRRGAGIDQVEAEKIAIFTRYLELSSREAREFWPVYDDFQNRRRILSQERQTLSAYYSQNYMNMSEKEAEEIADSYIGLQVKEAELAEEFHKKFKAVLPKGKVMRFYQAENEFRMQLLRRLRGGAGPGRGVGRYTPDMVND